MDEPRFTKNCCTNSSQVVNEHFWTKNDNKLIKNGLVTTEKQIGHHRRRIGNYKKAVRTQWEGFMWESMVVSGGGIEFGKRGR